MPEMGAVSDFAGRRTGWSMASTKGYEAHTSVRRSLSPGGSHPRLRGADGAGGRDVAGAQHEERGAWVELLSCQMRFAPGCDPRASPVWSGTVSRVRSPSSEAGPMPPRVRQHLVALFLVPFVLGMSACSSLLGLGRAALGVCPARGSGQRVGRGLLRYRPPRAVRGLPDRRDRHTRVVPGGLRPGRRGRVAAGQVLTGFVRPLVIGGGSARRVVVPTRGARAATAMSSASRW